MTKARKVELLYNRARGQESNASSSELKELRKYKVDVNEGSFFATKANISGYITAVDNGSCRLSFFDWCMCNCRCGAVSSTFQNSYSLTA